MNNIIPATRPVIGKDLLEIKQAFGLSTADAIWLFGLSITKWTQVAKSKAEEPIRDPTLALLARFLDRHPELSVVPKFPKTNEMFDFLNEITPVSQKRFSILLGSEASAAYRWRKPGARQSPTSERLMYFIKVSLLSLSENKRAEMLDDWKRTVEAEAQARGRENIFKSGRWFAEKEENEQEDADKDAE